MQRLRQTRKTQYKTHSTGFPATTPPAGSPAVDPSTALLTCLAPASVEALPRLDGTRLAYNHELNAELMYELCAALIRAGLAKGEDWKPCGEDALTVAKRLIMQAIDVERRDLLERKVDYYLESGIHTRKGT